MEINVWMDSWQMDCCGTPFQNGSKVSWRLRPSTGMEWLDTALPGRAVAGIDAVEDHHGGSSDQQTEATVLSIAAVHCQFEPEPVVGSGTITRASVANKWTGEHDGRQFAGFLVTVLVSDEPESQRC